MSSTITLLVGHFYPRPPRGGRRNGFAASVWCTVFLSTPSARRATLADAVYVPVVNISIHALREEGDRCRWRLRCAASISIHALREEGDSSPCFKRSGLSYFYPRPPRGGRRQAGANVAVKHNISIHALREEGDSKNGEKHLRFCFIIKRSAQIWKSLSKNIRKNSCDLHRTA